jgi:hypothetical protein
MSLLHLLILGLTYFTPYVLADGLNKPENCVASCQTALLEVVFSTSKAKGSKGIKACDDQLRISSLYLCSKEYCSDRQQRVGVEHIVESCQTGYGISLPDYQTYISSVSEEALQDTPRYTVDNITKKAVNHTLIPTNELYIIAYRSTVSLSMIYMNF